MFELPSVYRTGCEGGQHGVDAPAIDEHLAHRIPDLQRVRLAVKMIEIFMISILLTSYA
jgi:hypothetical protein